MRHWPDDVLWDANQYGPNSRAWFVRAVATAAWAGFAVLVVVGNEGGPVAVAAVLAVAGALYLVGFGFWLRDIRSVVEVRVVGGRLRLLTATGHKIWHSAEDVTRFHLTRTPFQDQDSPGEGSARMLLELRGGSVRYRGRWTALDVETTELTTAAWQRVCPGAAVTDTVKIRPVGGDYD
jgi:hypothetical protein